MSTPIEKLREYLLPKTLEHAARNSSFWAAQLGDAWQRVQTPADLVALPLLEKARAVEHQDDMRCGDATADFGSVSSGTTRVGDRLFRVERVPAELEALAEFHEMLGAARAPDDAPPGEPPLVLHIVTPNHGLPPGAPDANTLRLAWAHSTHLFEMARSALAEPVGGRRVSVVRASVSVMKQLTVWLQRAGDDPARFAVRDIGTNAGLVTTRWRALLEEAWGARVWDNYSLSELTAPATECEACGGYHFTAPPIVWEVIDPLSHQPVAAGESGLLVVTGLYPYVQRQPLIRYVTGDVVELGPVCALAHDRAFTFRGRLHQSVVDERDGRARYLLLSGALENVADAHPGVARLPHASEKLGLLPAGTVGQPKVRAHQGDDGGVVVTLGTTFVPELFVEESARLSSAVAGDLQERHPALADDVPLAVELSYAPPDEDPARWFVKHLM